MNGHDINFNLQTFLSEMRNEQNKNHADLSTKVDDVLERVHGHETRIVVVENTRKTMRWMVGVMIAGLLSAGADFIFNHLNILDRPASTSANITR